MSFTDRVSAERNKHFRAVHIDDTDTPFDLRALLLCPPKDRKKAQDALTDIGRAQEEEDYSLDDLEKAVRVFFEAVASDSAAARKYFADYNLADLLTALRLFQEETQGGESKSSD